MEIMHFLQQRIQILHERSYFLIILYYSDDHGKQHEGRGDEGEEIDTAKVKV